MNHKYCCSFCEMHEYFTQSILIIVTNGNSITAVLIKVVTFNIDFASRDGNRTHQNAFRSCDSNFVYKTIEIERIKNFDNQIKRTLVHSKKSLAMS